MITGLVFRISSYFKGKNKTNPSSKENGPHGQKLGGLVRKHFRNILLLLVISLVLHKNTHSGLYKRSI
jgi:hypothetical protein